METTKAPDLTAEPDDVRGFWRVRNEAGVLVAILHNTAPRVWWATLVRPLDTAEHVPMRDLGVERRPSKAKALAVVAELGAS